MTSASQAASSAGAVPNGAGGAAVLAAAIGCFAVSIVAVICDKVPTVARALNFYRPTGPLSGVTTTAICIWLATWAILHGWWRRRNVGLERVNAVAVVLLVVAMLLTFPPIGDLL